jgi:Nucleotide modification associated domain 2
VTTLFTYVVRGDYGSAPNPFWDTCTLVICKPDIRRVAKVGDWVVGTGSKQSPLGDARNRVIYAMRITAKLPMSKYDEWVDEHARGKLPDKTSSDPRRHVGDALYDFAHDPPRQRPGVHGPHDRGRDLSGRFALLSSDFYYFGEHAVALPRELEPIVKKGRMHRSISNAPYLEPFEEWIASLCLEPGSVCGEPSEWLRQRPGPQPVTIGPRIPVRRTGR